MTRNPSSLSARPRVDSLLDVQSNVPPPNAMTELDPPVDLRKWEQVLILWLEWNEVYERLTERLFEAQGDLQRIEALLDEADRLRKRASELSRQLLATGDADV